MNDVYDTKLPEPKWFATRGDYVTSLTGYVKMSKSVDGSFISLTDNLEEIRRKLSLTPTDSGKGTIRKEDPKKYDEEYIKKYISQQPTESMAVAVLMEFVELFEGIKKTKEHEEKFVGVG